MKHLLVLGIVGTAVATLLGSACSNNNEDTAPAMDAGKSDGNPGGGDGGMRSFVPPADPGPGGILLTASGEALALTGYTFPPATAGDPAFVDGWDVKFTRLLTTIDKITLSENPDSVPGDESQAGAVIAKAEGPWAVDLSHSDPTYLAGKGGPGEQAVPIAALSTQADGAAFKTDGTRYALGFDLIAATEQTADNRRTMNVNLDAAGLADYKTMVDDKCAALYVGVATFKGNKADPACYPAGYDKWPDVVNFRLCFKSPSTYVNCQNPDNDPAAPFPNEEHQRGIAFKSTGSVIGQVTMHTDHPFWDSVVHDSPAHFDPFAGRLVGVGTDGGAPPTATLDLTKGVDYTAYTDNLGNRLSWRYCMAPPTTAHPKFVGPMSFDPQTVPHATGGDATSGLRDFYDYSTYNQSTQGHLNSNGLGFVKRNYPSPR